MNKFLKLSGLSLIITCSLQANTGYINYKVQKGDSLFKIADKYDTTLKSLKQYNKINNSHLLKIGQTIKIKTKKNKNNTNFLHVVQPGETLSEIADNNNTTVAKLKQYNNIVKSNLIKAGQTIKLQPTISKKAAPAKVVKYRKLKHKVKRGETLSHIAMLHKTSVKEIAKANGLDNKSLIKQGNTLIIPTKSIAHNSTWKSNYFKSIDIPTNNPRCEKVAKVEKIAKSKLGKKYVWGASGNGNTYDCSSFTQHVYKKLGINIPRTSRVQSKYGKYVKRDELKKGDLIFFDTSKKRKGYVNHVGIYLGNNKFIHASSAKKKVVVSKLEKNFYSARYKGARRLIES